MRTLAGKTAIVTGASRGIGRECALALARQGANIVLAAKSTEPQPTLPGTIFTVAKEVEALGVKALPFALDLRDAERAQACVDASMDTFGRVDILVNNASALWWQDMVDTPTKKFDLIMGINARGAFSMTQACLPHMFAGGFGRVITMSPPVVSNASAFRGKTAYNMSKMGMTMVALGAAAEGRGRGVTGNSLWPATIVESLASKNFQLGVWSTHGCVRPTHMGTLPSPHPRFAGDPSQWRKPSILADCVVKLCLEGDDYSGNMHGPHPQCTTHTVPLPSAHC